jgi:hypothetical protein
MNLQSVRIFRISQMLDQRTLVEVSSDAQVTMGPDQPPQAPNRVRGRHIALIANRLCQFAERRYASNRSQVGAC